MAGDAYDVVIVGGSVAGSSAAIVLRGMGLRVAVIERSAEFRDRVRGEGIHPWGVAEAENLGLLDTLSQAGAHSLPYWQPYEDGEPQEPYAWSADTPRGHVERSVYHPRLQETLIQAAADTGARVLRPDAVARIDQVGDVTTVQTASRQSLRCRLLIGADGRHSLTRRLAAIGVREDPTHHRIGGCLLDGISLADDRTHDARFAGGRALMFPQGEGRARAYVVISPARFSEIDEGRSLDPVLALFRRLFPADAIERPEAAGPLAFFANGDVWAEALWRRGFVLIGDAAGANDPSLGHGLSLCWRDIRELRDAFEAHGLSEDALAHYAVVRSRYFDTLQQHARWIGQLTTEEGPEADDRRQKVAEARLHDPTAGGFSLIVAQGPRDLVADDAARARFFGEAVAAA